MMSSKFRLLGLALLVFITPSPLAGLPVVPGAKGFGTDTVAGSGRQLSPPQTEVMYVRSLNDSGSGTLRECAEGKGPRTCVFETSGTIFLTSPIRIDKPYLTIAGQTAPNPGVLLRGAGIKVASHDILIQHLRIRVGDSLEGPDPGSRDGISVGADSASAYNIVVDHCSVSWAIDENVTTWYDDTRDITFSNNIIAEGLDDSIHPKGPHSKGVMFGNNSRRISFHHNLVAHHVERNPYVKPGSSVEVVNNVVYGWGSKGGWMLLNLSDYSNVGSPVAVNFVGNYYKAGPASVALEPLFGEKMVEESRVYAKSNIGPTRLKDIGNEWSIASLPEKPHRSLVPAVPQSGIRHRTPEETYSFVLGHAGAYPAFRDAVDVRIIKDVREGKGFIKDCVEACAKSAGGWPNIEVRTHTLDIPKKPNKLTKSGYTKLEKWLHNKSEKVTAASSKEAVSSY